MDDIGHLIRQATKNKNLVELIVRESVAGYQSIIKFKETRNGGWGVGIDEDPVLAIEKALASGATELARVRETFSANERIDLQRNYETNPPAKLKKPKPIIDDDFEDLL